MPGKMAKNVTAPRKWKSSPNHPQAQLAYVTQPEIDMLVDANIYGSMDGKPNRGPKGIISLQGDIGGYEPPSQPSQPSGGGGGQGPHWNPPTPVATVPPPWVADPPPIVNIPPPNTPPPGWTPDPVGDTGVTSTIDTVDVAAEQDAIDDALAISLADQHPSTYTPPNEIYPWLEGGAPTENLVNVSQVGGGPNNPGSLLYGINLEDYGFSNNEEFLPQDFLDSLFEGSWTTGNEAVENAALAPNITENMTPGEAQAANEAAMAAGWQPNIGTWYDIEEGTHPLFPGGLEDYYNPYGNLGDAWHDPSGGPGWEGYGGDYYGDRRQAKLDLINALAGGAPAEDLQQSGFFDTAVDPYAEDQRLALEKGIFSGMAPGYTGQGMKRLLRSYGSGFQAPRYENVARGGIMGPWNNMRR